MTPEQRFLIRCLADFYSGETTPPPEPNFGWDSFWALAEAQDLGAVIYFQGKRWSVPHNIHVKLQNAFYSNVFFLVNREAILKEIAVKMQEAGIPFIPFKGWVVKACWPEPVLRSMGDVDFLIHHEDRNKADEIMLSLSLKRFVDNHAVWTYYDDQIVFEVHDHLFYEKLGNDIDYIAYFDRVWSFGKEKMDPSFHLVYLFAHMAKHITNKGIGFRYFLDLMFYCRAEKENLRWSWIFEQLSSLCLLEFAKTCFALCEYWFSFSSPIPVRELSPDFCDFVTNKMFFDGVFGLDNPHNIASGSAKSIRRSKLPYWIEALLISLRRLFPSYKDMQLIPWYRFVDGRPWLLPIAWVYRWIYCIVFKRKEGQNLLTEAFVRREEIDERNRELQDWGL